MEEEEEEALVELATIIYFSILFREFEYFILVSTLIKSMHVQQSGSPAPVLAELETFESSIKKLYSLLDDVCIYLAKVQVNFFP